MKSLLYTIITALLIIAPAYAQTYYVDPIIGNDNYDGLSPTIYPQNSGPVKSIHHALWIADSYDTVILADGTYTPIDGSNEEGIYIRDGDVTLRSANGPENCIINCQYDEKEPICRIYAQNITIQGITFKNAHTSIINLDGYDILSLTLKNCIFTNCDIYEYDPPLIHINGHTVNITDCNFTNIFAWERSTVLDIENCNCNITNSTFKDIWLNRDSKIINANYTNLKIFGSEFTGNYFYKNGTILSANGDSNLEVNESNISDNSFIQGGVLIDTLGENCVLKNNSINSNYSNNVLICIGIRSNSAQISGCEFKYNISTDTLISVISESTSLLSVSNCVFMKNSSNNTPGLIVCMSSVESFNLENCLIAENNFPECMSLINAIVISEFNITNCSILDVQYSQDQPPLIETNKGNIKNSIIVGYHDQIFESSNLTINYTNIFAPYNFVPNGDNYHGTGNINTDPLFADPNNGDYHLKSTAGRYDPLTESWLTDAISSPCIDAGNPAAWINDEPLGCGGRINMGCFGGTAHASKTDQCSQLIPGDANRDCRVNLKDFAYLGSNWLQSSKIDPNTLPPD